MLLLFVCVFSIRSQATNYVSAGVGPAAWNVATSWSPNGIPTSTDNVTILSGHTINNTSSSACANLTIAGRMNCSSSTALSIYGNYTVTGIESGNGSIAFIPGAVSGLTISGSGTFSTTIRYTFATNSNRTISSGVTIVKNDVTGIANTTVTNLGNVTFANTVNTNAGATWINSTNAQLTLKVAGFMSSRTFTANASGNTVTIGYAIGVLPTTTSGFYNLTLAATASGAKTLPANTIVANNLTINTLNSLNSNNFDLTVGGNWVNNGGFTQGSRTVTFNGTSTVSGNVTTSFNHVIITGTLTGHATNMNVGGNWTNNGTYTHNSGRVTFNGTTAMSGSSTTSFNNVTISGTLTGPSGTMNVAGGWLNNGTYTHNSGTINFNGTTAITGSSTNSFSGVTITGTLTAPSGNMNVAGNWANNGTFSHNSGTVTFNGTTTVSGSSATSFRNVTISGTLTGHATNMSVAGNWVNNGTFTHNSGTVTFNGTTAISGSSTNSFRGVTISGTLTAPASANINVAGNWVNNGTFTHNNGTVTFNGTTTISGSSTNSFNNVTISGTLTAPAANVNVAGNWVNNGTFTHSSGTITFNGTTTISGSSTTSFNIVTISGTLTGHNTNMNVAGNWVNNGTFTHNGGTVTFNGTTTISGSSTNSFSGVTISGTLTGPASANMNVAGNWSNNGTFTHNSGTVTFNGTTTINGSSTTTFNNFTLTGGVTGHATNMNVAGNWINSGTFAHNSGTVTFTGTTTVSGLSTTNFNNVTISGTLTAHASDMAISGNMTNNGTFTHNSGNVIFNGTTTVGGTSISSFYSITINGALTGHLSNMNVAGSFINNGTYNSNSGLITFNGSIAQTLSGSGTGTFESLTLSNASGLTMTGGTYNLHGTLTLSAGTLANSGSDFALIADVTRYARIAPVCASCGFSGDFTVQRFVPSRTIGTWADLSSPVSNATMADWDNELFMVYPFVGFDPGTGRPEGSNVMAYDEPTAAYYELNAATPLSPGQGFEIGLTDDQTLTSFSNTTITSYGTPNFGDFNIPLSYTAANGAPYPVGYSGENLVGNPFASAIALNSLNITNALSTVDVYDYTLDNYRTLSGSALIGPYQGFWAYAQGAGASIGIPETSKSTNTSTAINRIINDPTYFSLTIGSGDGSHSMGHTLKIACNQTASDDWDNADHPFRKSLNRNAPSITANAGNIPLSINTFNNQHETYIVPLTVETPVKGKYRISFAGTENITNDFPVILLEDRKTKQFINVLAKDEYLYTAETGDSKSRFVLHFAKSGSYTPAVSDHTDNEVIILQNADGNLIQFNLQENETTSISVLDLTGREIIQKTELNAFDQSVQLNIPENFHGMYLIVVQAGNHKTIKKFVSQ
jgi:hypothetical protein